MIVSVMVDSETIKHLRNFLLLSRADTGRVVANRSAASFDDGLLVGVGLALFAWRKLVAGTLSVVVVGAGGAGVGGRGVWKR